MKNIKYLLLTAGILLVSACEGPTYTFQGSGFDGGAHSIAVQPTYHTECEIVPQFLFEGGEEVELMVKCEETIR